MRASHAAGARARRPGRRAQLLVHAFTTASLVLQPGTGLRRGHGAVPRQAPAGQKADGSVPFARVRSVALQALQQLVALRPAQPARGERRHSNPAAPTPCAASPLDGHIQLAPRARHAMSTSHTSRMSCAALVRAVGRQRRRGPCAAAHQPPAQPAGGHVGPGPAQAGQGGGGAAGGAPLVRGLAGGEGVGAWGRVGHACRPTFGERSRLLFLWQPELEGTGAGCLGGLPSRGSWRAQRAPPDGVGACGGGGRRSFHSAGTLVPALAFCCDQVRPRSSSTRPAQPRVANRRAHT